MKDKRNEILAKNLIHYSVALKPGETIMIEIKGKETLDLAKEIIKEATQAGAIPFWYYSDESLQRHWVGAATEGQFKAFARLHLHLLGMRRLPWPARIGQSL